MAGSFINPSATKGVVECDEIPFRPQRQIVETYSYKSVVKSMDNGKNEVEKLRVYPQLSIKYEFKIQGKDSQRAKNLFRNPNCFKIPLWIEQENPKINISQNSMTLGGVETLDKADMQFWVLGSNFLQDPDNLNWYSPDLCGDYYPYLGKPLKAGLFQADGTNYIDTERRFNINLGTFAVTIKYVESPSTDEAICGYYTSASNCVGIYRLAGDPNIYCEAGYQTYTYTPDPSIQDGEYLTLMFWSWVPFGLTGVSFYFFRGAIPYDEIWNADPLWIGNDVDFTGEQGLNDRFYMFRYRSYPYSTATFHSFFYANDFDYLHPDWLETQYFDMEVGNLLCGTIGGVLKINGSTLSWSSTPDLQSQLNSTGYLRVDEASKYNSRNFTNDYYEVGCVVRRDMNDPTGLSFAYTRQGEELQWKKTICQYLGQCQFPAVYQGSADVSSRYWLEAGESIFLPDCFEVNSILDAVSMPNPIEWYMLPDDAQDLHIFFACVKYLPNKSNVMGFKTARTGITNPTLQEVQSFAIEEWLNVSGRSYEAGQFVFIWSNNDESEAVEIDSIVGNLIYLKTPTKYFHIDPFIMPCFKGFLRGDVEITTFKAWDYSTFEAVFFLQQNFRIKDYTPTEEIYEDLIVFEPLNYFTGRARSVNPDVNIIDYGANTIDSYKNRLLSRNLRNWGFYRRGYDEYYSMKQLLHYLNGKQRQVWLPTLDQDFVLTSGMFAGQQYVDVVNKGNHKISSYIESRAVILYYNEQTYILGIAGIERIDALRERVVFSELLPISIDRKETDYLMCFIVRCSLATDNIEIETMNFQSKTSLNFEEQV